MIPLSFDFGGEALRPDCIVKCSYGNDSIALLQWLYEYGQKHPDYLGRIVVLYNDTGWGATWWPARVENGERLAAKMGFIPSRTECMGFEKMVMKHNSFPDNMRRFCTSDLKIIPTMNWLAKHDPEAKAELISGVRREESHERRNWPEYLENDAKNEGRPIWSPLVDVLEAERDALIQRAGWEVLPHRSRECRCINANSTDLKTWSEEDIAQVEALESEMIRRNPGLVKFMFHPKAKKGKPEGIRAVVEWAKQVKKKEPSTTGCDSGFCTG